MKFPVKITKESGEIVGIAENMGQVCAIVDANIQSVKDAFKRGGKVAELKGLYIQHTRRSAIDLYNEMDCDTCQYRMRTIKGCRKFQLTREQINQPGRSITLLDGSTVKISQCPYRNGMEGEETCA